MGASVLSLPCFPGWKQGWVMPASLGSCQDMGLAERARTLQGCWRENTAAAWAPFHTSTCQIVDCHSSYFFFLHTPGSSFWQENKEGVLSSTWKGAKTNYPAAPWTSDVCTLNIQIYWIASPIRKRCFFPESLIPKIMLLWSNYSNFLLVSRHCECLPS